MAFMSADDSIGWNCELRVVNCGRRRQAVRLDGRGLLRTIHNSQFVISRVRCLDPPRMNLPNAITLARIFLVPLLVVVLLTKFEGRQIFGVRHELVGAAIFGIASLTDWLDGYLARRRQQIGRAHVCTPVTLY